jgi:hypothetical protein
LFKNRVCAAPIFFFFFSSNSLKGAPRRNKTGDAQLLKFVLSSPVKEQSDFTFVFESGNARDGVQEVVARLVAAAPTTAAAPPPALPPVSTAPKKAPYENPSVRAVREAGNAGGEARRRAAALAGDLELRSLHDELVKSGVVSEDEFWALRSAELDKQRADVMAQNPGPPAMLVGEVRPTLVKPGEVHYRLTAAMIRQIFDENPTVRRAYQDNVPHKRSEEEFWREYLQSRFVEAAGPRVVKSSMAGDIFALAEAEMEAERRAQLQEQHKKQVQDVNSMLLQTGLDLREGEGESSVAIDADCLEPASAASVNAAAAAEALASRFNKHSQLVLERAGLGIASNEAEDYGLHVKQV